MSATQAVVNAKSDFDRAIVDATTPAECAHLREILIHLILNLDAARTAAEFKRAKLAQEERFHAEHQRCVSE